MENLEQVATNLSEKLKQLRAAKSAESHELAPLKDKLLEMRNDLNLSYANIAKIVTESGYKISAFKLQAYMELIGAKGEGGAPQTNKSSSTKSATSKNA